MLKKIIKLLTGNALAQLVTFVSLPVITRLFSPENYGMYSSFLAIIAVMSVLGTLRLEFAIIIKAKVLVKHICSFLVYWNIILWVTVTGGVFLFFRNIEYLSIYSYLLTLFTSVSVVIFFVFSAHLNREELFGLMGASKTFQAVVMVLVQLTAGLLHYSEFEWLIFANGISFLLTTIFIFLISRKSINYSLVKKVNFKYIATCKNYIVYQAPAAVINTLTQNVFIFIIIYFYGASIGGFFALANRLLLAPSALIGKSIREVFIREANKNKLDSLQIKKLYSKTLLKLFAISIPAYLSAAVLSYLFFPIVFGSSWLEVSYIFPILCIWGAFLFCNAPATAMVYILELQKFSLVYEISSIILRLLASLIAHLVFNNYLISILSFSIISALSNGYYIYYVYKKI